MAISVPDTGENIALGVLVNKATPQDLVVKLFKSNTTPAETDTAATYTEADFSGYSAASLTGSSWGSPSGGSIAYAQQTFTHDSGGTSNSIYGYFVIQTSSGTLVWSERDASAPFTMTNNGDNIKLTPTITAS